MTTPNPEMVTPVDVPAPSERQSILEELEALGSETEDAEGLSLEPSEENNADGEHSSDDDDKGELDDGSEPDDGSGSESDAEPDSGIDEKKLAALQRQEKRQKDLFAQRDRELQEREQALAEREQASTERLKRFEELEKRASYDAAGVLEALGVSPEHFEEAARDLFSKRPGAKPDANTRASIAQREVADVAKKALAEVESLKKQLADRDTQQDLERRANIYIDKASKLVDEDTPIVAKLLGNSPGKFRDFLSATAHKLWKETGETPEHVDVIREMENIKRAELQELGIELPRGNSKQSAQSPKKPVGRTITNELVTPTQPRTDPVSDAEFRQDVLKGMAELEV